MKLIDTICPHCGGKLKVDQDSKECVCEFCGTKFLMDDENRQINIKYDNAEEAGYQFEKGRQKAQNEAREHQYSDHSSSGRKTKAKNILGCGL